MTSIELLAQRIGSVDAELACTLDQHDSLPSLGDNPLITTGAGGSEGPARYLAARMVARDAGAARFVPLSSFASGVVTRAHTLVVFSQGLSRNSRIALDHAQRFARALLVTAVSRDGEAEPSVYLRTLLRQGVELVQHGPAEESGLLIRVVGPASATLCAELLAAPPGQRAQHREHCRAVLAARACLAEAPALDGQRDCALLTQGDYSPFVHGLRWKLLESLGADPPIWDALQFAHGPLQAIYPREMTLLALSAGGPSAQPSLLDRLRKVLVAERHQLLLLRASLEPPLCWFEHDALLNLALLAALKRTPRDLANWPAKGLDGPLYDFAGESDAAAQDTERP